MVVCHCRVVSEREIRWSLQHGARTLDEVADACGAGTECGGCRPALVDLLREADRPGATLLGRRSA